MQRLILWARPGLAPELLLAPWRCPWLTRTAGGRPVYRPIPARVLMKRMGWLLAGLGETLGQQLVPAMDQARESFARFGESVAQALKPLETAKLREGA